jgi:simple sugar transport system permease protein
MKILKKAIKNDLLLEIVKYVIALILGVSIGAIIIILKGENPFYAYYVLLKGALGGRAAIAQTIRWTTPAILAGLATAIGFRIGVFNLGVEGQLYIGALVAAVVGYAIPMANGVHAIVALLLGSLAGGLYSLLPAILWMRYKINEVVNTLMLNYVAYLLTEYITRSFLMGNSNSAVPRQIVSPEIANSAKLPLLMPPYQANVGIIIAVILAIVLYYFFSRTSTGYDLNIIGQNQRFAAYGGVNVRRLGTMAFIVSGIIGGLTGAIEILGVHHKFAANFSVNLGFDGVLIALLAKNNSLGIIFVGLFWGILKNGAFAMERMTSANRIVIQVVQALFVLFLTVDTGVLKRMLEKRMRLNSKEVKKHGDAI